MEKRNPAEQTVLARELEYHEKLYSGFAQQHFAKPAVRALREHMVGRLTGVCELSGDARVLSLGCGIGDTEILLARRVGEVQGIDLSPAAVRQARLDAERAGATNTRFDEGSLDGVTGQYDAVIAIFFLHHLPDDVLASAPGRIFHLLKPNGRFYSLDPNRYRLSGAVGRLFMPGLMTKYQTPDERELDPAATARQFARAGFDLHVDYYDFLSSLVAGLFPSWWAGYRLTRLLDEPLRLLPVIRNAGSNFEIIASRPG